MTYIVDPERREVRALERVARWRGRLAIELGCGDGRLTLRLAGLGARVLAIDPDRERIRAARRGLPERFAERIRYRVGRAGRLGALDQSFDLAVFSWAL